MIEVALVAVCLLTAPAGPLLKSPRSIGWIAVMVAVGVAASAISWKLWRCPACGKSPGKGSQLNFCGACGTQLAAGANRRSQATPERAEWVVATLRRRCWWVRIAWFIFLGGFGVVAWRFGPIEARPLRVVVVLLLMLGVAGVAGLSGRIWRCPECQAALISGFDLRHFCTRCGVPHDRKGLERARA